eukprot:scaffold9753_cov73-Cylindrotheca_fusiformis.AAC.6
MVCLRACRLVRVEEVELCLLLVVVAAAMVFLLKPSPAMMASKARRIAADVVETAHDAASTLLVLALFLDGVEVVEVVAEATDSRRSIKDPAR